MQHPAVLAEDVLYGEAPYQEGIGDHPPVTTPPHRLRAHKADSFAAFAELDQSPEVGAELVGLHVVGVGAEGRVGPTRVRRVRSWRSASPQTRKVRVPDALTRQSLPEHGFVELGVAPGGGKATHVYEVLNARFPEKLEQLLEGSRRVSDGEDEAAGILRIGPIRPLLYDVAPVVANL